LIGDVPCVDGVIEQLFHRLADESGKLTLTQLQLLINQLPDDHYRVARQTEDHDDDDHDNEKDHDKEDGHDHDEEDGHDHDDAMNVSATLLHLM